MYQLILLVHVIIAVCIVALVLVQQGKGATMGAAFGSGASQTVFGSRGSGSFLLRLTLGFVFIFFTTSIVLNRIATDNYKQSRQIAVQEDQSSQENNLDSKIPALPKSSPSGPKIPKNLSPKK